MNEISASLALALDLVAGGESRLAAIVLLSLKVSLGATLMACALGMPLGALLSVGRFPGRRVLIVLFNGLMGLPPVVVGLLVYLLLSRAAARSVRSAVHADGDGHRPDGAGRAHHRGTDPAGHRRR
jgi:tungstate transport system permease protein